MTDPGHAIQAAGNVVTRLSGLVNHVEPVNVAVGRAAVSARREAEYLLDECRKLEAEVRAELRGVPPQDSIKAGTVDTLWGLPIQVDPSLEPGEWRIVGGRRRGS